MHGNSSNVISNQPGIHEQLEATVRKHLNSDFKRPIAEHAQQAWQQLDAAWDRARPLILDSGCGTAQSTERLALKNPNSLVVGVDRSEIRLDKRQTLPTNALLLRTNLEDLWRLLAAAGVRLQQHSLLYPNPYPKAAQLRYRWHGSPAFKYLLQLGGELSCRSNWLLYLEELSLACEFAGVGSKAVIKTLEHQALPMTAFEDKYQQSQQPLYELKVDLT